MPMYDYAILDRKGNPTGEYVELFHSIHDDAYTRHPKDGRRVRRVILRAPAIERTWHGQECEDITLQFDPKGIGKLKQECPSIELNDRGGVVYRNNAHQRKVLREMQSAAKRAKDDGERRRAQRRNQDDKAASKAVAGFMTRKGA